MIPARNSAREEAGVHRLGPVTRSATRSTHLHFLPPVPGPRRRQPQTLEVAVNEAVLGQEAGRGGARRKAPSNATKLMEDNLEKFGG